MNKWENGNAYPDILLLAPLARVLKTDIDTLLSFREELTEKEQADLINEIAHELVTKEYETVFEKGAKLIREYPDCEALVLNLAIIFNSYLVMQEMEDKSKYKAQIIAWLNSVVNSKNQNITSMATATLCQNYMANEEYEKAQHLLDEIPARGFDKRLTQASLYTSQNQYDKAYEVHEQMLFEYANGIMGSLVQRCELLCKEKKYEEAYACAAIAKEVAKTCQIGSYSAATAELLIALEQKDKEASLQKLSEMVESLDSFEQPKSSMLYSHMKFKKDNDTNDIKKMLYQSFVKDAELDFLREDRRFEKLLERLK